MSNSLGERLFWFLDRLAYRAPRFLLRVVAMPIGYHLRSDEGHLYQSANMAFRAFQLVMNNQVPGDYAEFGVLRGRGIIDAHRLARKFKLDMRIWAFDSFRGLPEVAGIDADGPFHTGEFACSRDEFDRNLRRYRIDPGEIRVVEGFYEESLDPKNGHDGPERVAIAWIDCDLYESTVPVLEFLTNRLVEGSVICFDDWYSYNGRPDRGEPRACTEWLARHREIRLVEYMNFHWAGKSFLVNRLDAV